MKIAVAQIESIRGDLQSNLKTHLNAIDLAGEQSVDLILFPELSLSGYFPEIAKSFVDQINDEILNIIQKKSDFLTMNIAVGVPTKGAKQPKISLIYFSPEQERQIYSKQILHEDELEFFEPGSSSIIWEVKGEAVCPAICYESMQVSHNRFAANQFADIYACSVAKSVAGMGRSNKHYKAIAKECKMHVVVSNFVGDHGGFIAGGGSTVWDFNGKNIAQLNEKETALLIYDNKATKVLKLEI